MTDNFIQSETWETFKARLQGRWQGLSDDLLESYRENFNALAREISNRLEESKDGVQDFIDSLWFEVYVRGTRQALRYRGVTRNDRN